MALDPGFAVTLKAPATNEKGTNAGLPAGLQASAIESEIASPFFAQAGATSEVARQIAFLGGPLATEEHLVPGQQSGLIGRAVTITASRMGYAAGLLVFVIGAEELENNATRLLVLRRLT